MARNGYCKTCGKEVRPKYGVPEESPVWKAMLLVILFIVTYGIALIIYLLKRIKYCPLCGNEVVTFKSKDEVSRYYLKEEDTQFRAVLELKADEEVSSSFRKRVEDKVAQYRKQKDKENRLNDDLGLSSK